MSNSSLSKQWTKQIEGTSTAWANLPEPMELKLDTARPGNLLVLASLSRVQHTNPSINTAFRIRVDERPVAVMNTGTAHDWAYDTVTLHALVAVETGHHHVVVEYQTQGGTVMWVGNNDGEQQRTLTAISLPA